MSAQLPIGLTKGPGEAPHEFTFISPDRSQLLKIGEYITHEAEVDGQFRSILSRVIDRKPLRLYPDAFLADPNTDPGEVASLVGYGSEEHELFELTAAVIGYYEDEIEDFVNPRLPPREGGLIFLASDELLSRLLTKKELKEIGSAHIGSLLSRATDKVPVSVDVGAIASMHLAIIASTGAGKSYLAGVLLEEMMMPYNRAAILVVDPHGEYDTLAEMMNSDLFRDDNYRPEVKIFRPGDVKLRVSAMTIGDLKYLLPNLSERMDYLLRRAYRDVRRQSQSEKGDPERWTVAELEIRLRQIGEGEDEPDGEKKDTFAGTADALIWRLDSVLRRSVVFDDFEHLKLSELFQPGRCSVLQLDQVDEKEQQVIVAALLRRALFARTQTLKGKVDEGDDLYIPYPVFTLIEEAHRFAPTSADIVSTGILKTVLSEGRKFGVGVGLISQRPGKLDSDVLSQCNTQFIMRIVNPVDQARVAESVETVGRDLLRELPALTKGQAIVTGEAVSTPILCRVRKRYTRHGGETMDAPVEWLQYHAVEQEKRRQRRKALPLELKDSGESKMFK